ncbi:MAG: hypothetical protein LCH30_12045, partial [Proteobacteria bacterium]|nr:hypothetical protein [Pseudomonadota bacterium]
PLLNINSKEKILSAVFSSVNIHSSDEDLSDTLIHHLDLSISIFDATQQEKIIYNLLTYLDNSVWGVSRTINAFIAITPKLSKTTREMLIYSLLARLSREKFRTCCNAAHVLVALANELDKNEKNQVLNVLLHFLKNTKLANEKEYIIRIIIPKLDKEHQDKLLSALHPYSKNEGLTEVFDALIPELSPSAQQEAIPYILARLDHSDYSMRVSSARALTGIAYLLSEEQKDQAVIKLLSITEPQRRKNIENDDAINALAVLLPLINQKHWSKVIPRLLANLKTYMDQRFYANIAKGLIEVSSNLDDGLQNAVLLELRNCLSIYKRDWYGEITKAIGVFTLLVNEEQQELALPMLFFSLINKDSDICDKAAEALALLNEKKPNYIITKFFTRLDNPNEHISILNMLKSLVPKLSIEKKIDFFNKLFPRFNIKEERNQDIILSWLGLLGSFIPGLDNTYREQAAKKILFLLKNESSVVGYKTLELLNSLHMDENEYLNILLNILKDDSQTTNIRQLALKYCAALLLPYATQEDKTSKALLKARLLKIQPTNNPTDEYLVLGQLKKQIQLSEWTLQLEKLQAEIKGNFLTEQVLRPYVENPLLQDFQLEENVNPDISFIFKNFADEELLKLKNITLQIAENKPELIAKNSVWHQLISFELALSQLNKAKNEPKNKLYHQAIENLLEEVKSCKQLNKVPDAELISLLNDTTSLLIRDMSIQDYSNKAKLLEGKPSTAFKAIAISMLALSCLMLVTAVVIGLIGFGLPISLAIASSSIIPMAAGIGFFVKAQPKGLAKVAMSLASEVESKTI